MTVSLSNEAKSDNVKKWLKLFDSMKMYTFSCLILHCRLFITLYFLFSLLICANELGYTEDKTALIMNESWWAELHHAMIYDVDSCLLCCCQIYGKICKLECEWEKQIRNNSTTALFVGLHSESQDSPCSFQYKMILYSLLFYACNSLSLDLLIGWLSKLANYY